VSGALPLANHLIRAEGMTTLSDLQKLGNNMTYPQYQNENFTFGNLFFKNPSGGQSEIPCTKIWSTSRSEGTPPLKQLQISWKFHV